MHIFLFVFFTTFITFFNVTGGNASSNPILCQLSNKAPLDRFPEKIRTRFAEEMNLEREGWKAIEGQKSLRKRYINGKVSEEKFTNYKEKLNYQLSPNGTLSIWLQTRLKKFPVIRYKCNVNSIELASEYKENDFASLKTQSDYENFVAERLKEYLRDLKKSGYSRHTKTLLREAKKHKAQAFCFDWKKVIPSALEGRPDFNILSAGNFAGAPSLKNAKTNALAYCNRRPATQTGQCKCEILNENGKFQLSDAAKAEILKYLAEKDVVLAAKTGVEDSAITDEQSTSSNQGVDPAATKSEAKIFFDDVVAFIKTKPKVDIVKFADLYNSRPDLTATWSEPEFSKYLKIKRTLLDFEEFNSFVEKQKKERNIFATQRRTELERALQETITSLENVVAENFGTEHANNALILLKKNRKLNANLAAVKNEALNTAVKESNGFLGVNESEESSSGKKVTASNEVNDAKNSSQSVGEVLKGVAAGAVLSQALDPSNQGTIAAVDGLLGALAPKKMSQAKKGESAELTAKGSEEDGQNKATLTDSSASIKDMEPNEITIVEKSDEQVLKDFKIIWSKMSETGSSESVFGISNLKAHIGIVRDTARLLRSTPEIQKEYQNNCNFLNRIDEGAMQFHESLEYFDKITPGVLSSYEKCWNNFAAFSLEQLLPENVAIRNSAEALATGPALISMQAKGAPATVSLFDTTIEEELNIYSPERLVLSTKTDQVLYLRRPSIVIVGMAYNIAIAAATKIKLDEAVIAVEEISMSADSDVRTYYELIDSFERVTIPYRYKYLNEVNTREMVASRVKLLSITPEFLVSFQQIVPDNLKKRANQLKTFYQSAVDENAKKSGMFNLAELNAIENLQYFYYTQRCYDHRKGYLAQYVNKDQIRDAKTQVSNLKKRISSAGVSINKVDVEAQKVLSSDIYFLTGNQFNETGKFMCSEYLTKLQQVSRGQKASGRLEKADELLKN